jgi:hypothetical protein
MKRGFVAEKEKAPFDSNGAFCVILLSSDQLLM